MFSHYIPNLHEFGVESPHSFLFNSPKLAHIAFEMFPKGTMKMIKLRAPGLIL